jgi:AcrR family transcriptional regulator
MSISQAIVNPAPVELRQGSECPLSGRERLLDAAITLFAERGIANTTVAQIARAGRVTPAMVHYWFDTRDRLYDAVVEERIVPSIRAIWSVPSFSEAVLDDPQAQVDARGMVLELVRSMVQVAESSPWLPSLWLREIVQVGGLLQDRVLRCLPDRKSRAFRERIEAAQARGEINPAIAPDLLFVSMMALVMLPLAAAPALEKAGKVFNAKREHIESHACALLGAGLATTDPVTHITKQARREYP